MTAGRQPDAVLVAGPPASGKTTLGAALAPRLNAAFIDLDVATQALTDVVASLVGVGNLDDARLASLTREARYETVIRIAESNLSLGAAVVIVAPFSRERKDLAAWHRLERRLTAAGARPTLVWLKVEPAELLRRLRGRSAERDADKLLDEADWLTQVDLRPPVGPHIPLDADQPLVERVSAVLRRLNP
jgi:predicted kinase